MDARVPKMATATLLAKHVDWYIVYFGAAVSGSISSEEETVPMDHVRRRIAAPEAQ